MAVERSYVTENDSERARLQAVVGRLSDEELSRPLGAGWTIAGALAHLAFWDQRVLVLLDRWTRGAAGSAPRSINHDDVDWVNDAAKALCLALPPRAAAELAVATADAADRAAAALSADLVSANAAAGSPINLVRADHRREHLDEIERALRR